MLVRLLTQINEATNPSLYMHPLHMRSSEQLLRVLGVEASVPDGLGVNATLASSALLDRFLAGVVGHADAAVDDEVLEEGEFGRVGGGTDVGEEVEKGEEDVGAETEIRQARQPTDAPQRVLVDNVALE